MAVSRIQVGTTGNWRDGNVQPIYNFVSSVTGQTYDTLEAAQTADDPARYPKDTVTKIQTGMTTGNWRDGIAPAPIYSYKSDITGKTYGTLREARLAEYQAKPFSSEPWTPTKGSFLPANVLAAVRDLGSVQYGGLEYTRQTKVDRDTGQQSFSGVRASLPGDPWNGTRYEFDPSGNFSSQYVKEYAAPSWLDKNAGTIIGVGASLIPGGAALLAGANALEGKGINPLAVAASLAGIPGVSDAVGAGVTSAIQTANQANNLVNAIESGNVLGALASGANLTGTGGVQIGDTGVSVADALKGANIAQAVESGNMVPLIGALASEAQKNAAVGGPNANDFEAGSFGNIEGEFDPATYGSVDLTQPSYTAPSTDYTVDANYELFPTSKAPEVLPEMGGAQGLQAPELPDVFTDDGVIDYSLFAPTPSEGEPSLQLPTTPNLDSMGGGQGLVLPVEGGAITEAGFIPSDYVAPLGDTESFINQPAPGADVHDAVEKALEAAGVVKTPEATKPTPTPTPTPTPKPAQTTTPKAAATPAASSNNLLALLALAGLGEQPQQQAVQEVPADVKSFEEQGFGDLFGTKLQFSDGGSVDDLLNLLRG